MGGGEARGGATEDDGRDRMVDPGPAQLAPAMFGGCCPLALPGSCASLLRVCGTVVQVADRVRCRLPAALQPDGARAGGARARRVQHRAPLPAHGRAVSDEAGAGLRRPDGHLSRAGRSVEPRRELGRRPGSGEPAAESTPCLTRTLTPERTCPAPNTLPLPRSRAPTLPHFPPSLISRPPLFPALSPFPPSRPPPSRALPPSSFARPAARSVH